MGWQVDWNLASLDSRVHLSLSAAELEFHRISLVERSKLQWTGAGTSDNLVGGRYSTKAARKAAGEVPDIAAATVEFPDRGTFDSQWPGPPGLKLRWWW